MKLGTATIAKAYLGSTEVSKLYLGSQIAYLADADLAAFVADSGATAISGLASMVDYLKAESLWSAARFYPLKAAQNAGSGPTVYGLGGLASADMTLVGSPTWGAGGIQMNATTQYAHFPDCLDASSLNVFVRRSGAGAAINTYFAGQWDFAASERSWSVGAGASDATKLKIQRSTDGGSTNIEIQESGTGIITATDTCYVSTIAVGSSATFWKNKTSGALTRTLGSEQTTRFNAADPILINAAGVPGATSALAGGTYVCVLVITGTITLSQREAITDLINAL